MHSWPQKFFSGLMVAIMLITLLPTATLASEPETMPLEKAIQVVKSNFSIPAEYTTFKSGFNESDNQRFWSLAWNNSSEKGGSFNAQLNANTGEITSMNLWRPESGPQNPIPAISLNEAQKIAQDLLQKIIPNRISSLNLITDNPLIPITSYGPTNYHISWQRTANTVPVAGEGAYVEINSATGEVLNYNLNWSNLELPASDRVISPTQARETFINEEMLQLEYTLPNNMRPLLSGQKQSPILVYRIVHSSSGKIDALTGKPIIPEADYWLSGGGGADDKYMVSKNIAPTEMADVPLTPQEKEEISKTSTLISQDVAIKALAKWVDIPDNLVFQSANLDSDWRDPSVRIWNLSWSSDSSIEPKLSSRPLGLYARLNAKTGELISFNLDIHQDTGSAVIINQEAAMSKANDFLKKTQPARFSQMKLDPVTLAREKAIEVHPGYNPTTWNFNYQRTVNGITFPENGADIRIDRTSGIIVSYNLNWMDMNFPSAQNVIGFDKANELFLQSKPITLCYATYFKAYWGSPEMRLVYQPEIPPGQAYFYMIDAHSGKKLNGQGLPIAETAGVIKFNDIAGNFAEKEISLLGQAGLMYEYQNEFHPNEKIKVVDLLRVMLATTRGKDSTRNLSDQEIINRSLESGWIKEGVPPNSEVTRGFMAQLMVRYLDLEYVAQIPDIYQLAYKDKSTIGKDLTGYAALCWGLGIIRGDGIYFDSSHNVSRAEAAFALVKTLGAKTRS
ncbi:MAG: hypothetical protein PHF24_03980 [Syntrophomonas sp.]|nr:hypothetical protein [Syntrophomonas sp.]